jgi:glutamyl-tRNA synthetase
MGFPVFPLKWVNPEGEVSRGYREDGYFPEAFVNLLAMLGWNPGDERELFTLEELVEAFSIERIVKSGARFNPDKAKWYNKEYLRKRDDESLCEDFMPILAEKGVQADKDYVLRVVKLIKERATFVQDFWSIASYLFVAPTDYAEKDVAKFWKEENYSLALQVADFISSYDKALIKEEFEVEVEEFIRSREWPMGKVMNCLRLALVGASSGLGIADIVCLIGLEEFSRRVAAAKATLC